MADNWSLSSWKSKDVHQDVIYQDQKQVDSILEQISHLPPIVVPEEITRLRQLLSEVAVRRHFE